MIPYIPQKCYSVEELIDDCRRLFALCHVDYFSIVGCHCGQHRPGGL